MNFKDFLIKAKKATYSNEYIVANILSDGAKELIFKEGKYFYRDRYFGHNPFLGQEIVYNQNKIFWGMNYFGFCKNKLFVKKIYSFLKKALNNPDEFFPVRGPKKFREKEFFYSNNFTGDIKRFSGDEKIFYNGKEVYSLKYFGGFL